MLERLFLERLLDWKNRPERKPMLLDGARQVGKTYLLEKLFGPRHFRRVHKLDLDERPELHDLFADSLSPSELLPKMEAALRTDIDLRADLLLLDEIGECQRAVDSLKYFSEQRPDGFIAATGSNVGLLESFPVGRVESLEVFPLTFEEFLMAAGNARLLQQYREMAQDSFLHGMLWRQLLDYYYVGGMPAAAAAWFRDSDGGMHSRFQEVREIQRGVLKDYERDFGKYSGRQNSLDLHRVFRSVPQQLSRSMDGSVRRYHFKDVLKRKSRYVDLCGPIDWLERAQLISKCYVLDCRPAVPLRGLIRENIFKLYFLDVGLLGCRLELDYAEQVFQQFPFKGFIAENFVQNELLAQGMPTSYSWSGGRSEIEFLYQTSQGDILPVEVKSGMRTRAKSLRAYREKYRPERTLKLIGGAGGRGRQDMVWPLYYARFLTTL